MGRGWIQDLKGRGKKICTPTKGEAEKALAILSGGRAQKLLR